MQRTIKKTIVGSLPRLDDSLAQSIERAIDIQCRYGLDIVTDGEQRTDMIGYFEQIPGLTRSGAKVGVSGRIHRPNHVEDSHKLKDYTFARKYLDDKGMKDVELKVEITGPTTLGFTCATTQLKGYSSVADLELYRDLASALQPLIDELLRLGAYVQIDEPGLSAEFVDPVQATAFINDMVADLKHFERGTGKLSVHVCGDLTKGQRLFDLLTKLDVDILSFAFGGKVEGRNLELLSNNTISNSGKRLGFGCISVASPNINSIEPVQEVVKLLNEGIQRIGVERLAYVHPNCGLRNTPLDVTEEILSRMRTSVEQVSMQSDYSVPSSQEAK
jgi:methionine synthase II (cobalamin-independent)